MERIFLRGDNKDLKIKSNCPWPSPVSNKKENINFHTRFDFWLFEKPQLLVFFQYASQITLKTYFEQA